MDLIEEAVRDAPKTVEDQYILKMLALANQMIEDGVPFGRTSTIFDEAARRFINSRLDLKRSLNVMEVLAMGRLEYIEKARREIVETSQHRESVKYFELLEEEGYDYGEA